LTDSAIPIDFGLRIGADDFGSTTIPLRGELKFREEHHHGHDHDDD
jgi:hypothetical protein